MADFGTFGWGDTSWGASLFKETSYYLDLLTSQYRNSTKLNDWLEAYLNMLNDASITVEGMYGFFALDSALGDQLDILGEIIGQSRTLSFQPTSGSSILDDTNYRLLLKAKIVKNHWNGQIGSLVSAWSVLFPDGQIIVTDNQDMSMDVLIVGNFDSLTQELIENGYIVPKPEGVKVNYAFGTLPVFGYDLDTGYVAGYDTGSWFSYT